MIRTLPFLLTISLLFIIGCQREPSEVPPLKIKPLYGGIYRKPLAYEPRILDPPKATDIYSVTLIQQLFDGLLQFDKDLNIIPAIAKSWTVSQDGLVYTFFLREGIKFHSGREVTAEDFVFSFTRIVRPETGSDVKEMFDKISGIEEFLSGKSDKIRGLQAKDRYTLEITLKESFASFMVILAMTRSKVVPFEEVAKWGDKFGKHPVGTGAFRFVSWEPSKEIVLEVNKDYFEGRPYLDRIAYRIFPGQQNEKMFQEFIEENLENSIIPGQRRSEIISKGEFPVIRKPTLNFQFYGFNNTFGPLKDKRVRQAINYAIDRERIIEEATLGKYIKTDGILPLGMPGYNPKRRITYSYNPEKAKRLLEEAGYPGGKGIPVLEFLSASKSETFFRELEIVKSNLKDIGITIKVRFETDWPTFERLLVNRKTQIYKYAWYADYPDPENFLSILFHSRAKYNYTNFTNDKVDQLLNNANTEVDFIKRIDNYRQAEEIILEQAPVVPVFSLPYEEIYQPYVKGIEVSALGAPYIPMKKIWLDVKTSARND